MGLLDIISSLIPFQSGGRVHLMPAPVPIFKRGGRVRRKGGKRKGGKRK